MLKKQIPLIIFTLVFVTPLLLQAKWHGEGRKRARHRNHPPSPMSALKLAERFSDQLGISSKTLDAIKSKVYDAQEEHIKLEAELKLARLNLKRAMEQDEPNRDKVMQKVEKVGRLETDLKKQRITLMLSVRSILTPKQRKGLKRLIEAKSKGHSEGERGPPHSQAPM
jgi:Spy/CpxP family protein refolding chaperone